MADKKISELTELTTPDGTEELVVNDSGVSKKVQIDNLIADNGLSGDKIDGGTISNFTSTGIDDNATSTAITIDANDNVGIGVTPESSLSSQTALQVGGTGVITSSTTAAAGADTHYGQNAYLNTSGAWAYQVTDEATLISQNDGNLRFRVAPSGTADTAITWTTAMTIDNSANLIWYQTPTSSAAGISFTNTTHPAINISGGSDTGSRHRMTFTNGNGLVGNITTSGSSTAYNTSSDYRLKEDDQPMVGSIDRLKALRPINFAWKADGSRVDGFLAHEAQEVVPECATGTKDAMRDEEYEVTPAVMDGETVVTEAVMGTRSVPDYQGIDQSKLVPLLVASLQEAVAKIEALEARVTALEV